MHSKNVLRIYHTATALSTCFDDVSKIGKKITDFPGNCFDARCKWT